MERDPLRFSWRTAPGLNAALVALVLVLGLPTLWLALDVVRFAVDIAGGPHAAGTRFLRYAIELPERIRATPLVIAPGFALQPAALPKAVVIAFAAVLVGACVLWWLAGAFAAHIGRRMASALIERLVQGIASAPIAASEEARQAVALAGDALGRDRRALGLLAVTPVIVVATVALAVAYVTTRSLEMGLVLLIGLCATSLVANRHARGKASVAAADKAASATLLRSLSELARHLSAVAAHGTRTSEGGRITSDLARLQVPADRLEMRDVLTSTALLATLLLGPLGVLTIAGRPAISGVLTGGTVASAGLAAAIAVVGLFRHVAWRRTLERVRPFFVEAARALGHFQARRRTDQGVELPPAGDLVAAEVSTAEVATGRLVAVDLDIRLPDHVALYGARDSGARTFAGLLGGQIVPSGGRLTFAGADLPGAAAEQRARRFAFAGGETYLFPGSLRTNLLYGSDEAASGIDERLSAAITVAGLDALVQERGLAGSTDPKRDPALAEAIVSARASIRAGLTARGMSDLVEPFQPEQYNRHATIGENILSGVALGDTFREDRLPSQPFMRSLIDGEGLTKPLAAIGAAVASSTLEMFADVPDASSILGRFALIAPTEREEFEQILDRRETGGRTPAASRDTERLVGLALRYCEPRHRLGLLDDDLQGRIVRLRSRFCRDIPKALEPAVEFFHPDRVCAAAGVRGNLLFGHVAQDRANAERDVIGVIHAVLAEIGLTDGLARVGLGSRVDARDLGMSDAEVAAIDVVRCLVRAPDTVVIEHALDHLSDAEVQGFVRRLTTALAGRGLLIVVPDDHADAVSGLIEHGVRFEAGRIVPDADETRFEALPTRIAS